MDDIYVKTVTLRKLHGLIERGIFPAPELAREFVWNARKGLRVNKNETLGVRV